MKNNICDLIGIDYPIIQGAMAWVANASLAAAVSNAGGLGIIASGNMPVDLFRAEVKKAKELTDKPFGVNIMLLDTNAEEVAKIVVEEGIKVVTTGAGNPGKYMKMWKEAGVVVMPVVASCGLAKRMEKSGADAIIAEGCEAGGHIGKLTTMALTPQVVEAVSIPVIAAGGIANGRGLVAALALGAQGVQIGTRFLVANECTIHKNYKDLIINSKDIDVVVTGRVTGHPVQSIKNKLARQMMKLEKEDAKPEEFEELGRGSLSRAVLHGDLDNGSFMAGQVAGLVTREQSCKEIIEELIEGASTVIKGLKENI